MNRHDDEIVEILGPDGQSTDPMSFIQLDKERFIIESIGPMRGSKQTIHTLRNNGDGTWSKFDIETDWNWPKAEPGEACEQCAAVEWEDA